MKKMKKTSGTSASSTLLATRAVTANTPPETSASACLLKWRLTKAITASPFGSPNEV
jgi:hypothetical protein